MRLNIFAPDRSEPRIITLDAPVMMAGVSARTGIDTIFRDVPALGKKYQTIKQSIPDRKVPWAFVAISKNFSSDTRQWDYLMGDVVTSFDSVPADLEMFSIPSGTYAVFTVRPAFTFLFGILIGRTKQFTFTEWLPGSPYEADTAVLGDFEYHDERSTGRHPSIEVYVPVRKKEKT
ncbi:MAG: effector binding domain-containing protein [Methanoregula sp.]|jgi:predicted transcriptional regulator YdeE